MAKQSFINAGTLQGRFTDVNRLPSVPKNPYDEEYVIQTDADERPDILAYKLYGSVDLWWVFALRNPDVIVDPIRDFKAGTTIFLPSREVINSLTGA
jgi:hypothetical protein|tara:strand:- start:32 stop:322 length:291 start_codon:yes stop_codon:yes gene_type:complete